MWSRSELVSQRPWLDPGPTRAEQTARSLWSLVHNSVKFLSQLLYVVILQLHFPSVRNETGIMGCVGLTGVLLYMTFLLTHIPHSVCFILLLKYGNTMSFLIISSLLCIKVFRIPCSIEVHYCSERSKESLWRKGIRRLITFYLERR